MFGWLFKWLFRELDSPHTEHVEFDSEDVPVEYLSREEAETLAAREAIRDVRLTPERITYVTFFEPFDDYCRIEINFQKPDQGLYQLQLLPPDERLESETIDDKTIERVARSRGLLNAVRMYRNLHSADLYTAKVAVEKMMKADGE